MAYLEVYFSAWKLSTILEGDHIDDTLTTGKCGGELTKRGKLQCFRSQRSRLTLNHFPKMKSNEHSAVAKPKVTEAQLFSHYTNSARYRSV